MATKAKLYLLTSVVLAVMAAALAGCGDIGDTTGTNPANPTVERGVNLGSLELYYDFRSGEGTATFTPNTEVSSAAANINALGVTGYFGKSIYDKRTNIPSLGGAGTGPACILGLALQSTGNYVVVGPVFQVQTNQVLNELYATSGGTKIGQNVTPLDVDPAGVLNPAVVAAGPQAFLLENDYPPAAVGQTFGWSQTYESNQVGGAPVAAEASDALFTNIDGADGLARYNFYQVNSGWAGRTWAPAFQANGDTGGGLTRGTAADATPPNAVCLAMGFTLPLTAANEVPDGIFVKGNLMADAIIDSHTMGPDANWTPSGGASIDVEQSFDFDTVRGLAVADQVTTIDRDATGRIYCGMLNATNGQVSRLMANMTAQAGDNAIIPQINAATTLNGLDVVDAFSKIYVSHGNPATPTGLVNIYSIPADGANATAIATLDVATDQAANFAAGDLITDIIVDPTQQMLYVAYGGSAGDDGRVVGYQLNADGTLVDGASDTTSAVGIFNANGGVPGGKLGLNTTTGAVYVSSGNTAASNGVNRLVANTLGADGTYDLPGAVAETYANVAVDPDGNVYAAVVSAHVAVYNAGASPDVAGANDVRVFAAAAGPAASQGVVRFNSDGTYATGTWLFGDVADGATAPAALFAGNDASGAATQAPTDFVYWGTGAVTGTSKLLFADDFGGAAAGMNIAWGSM